MTDHEMLEYIASFDYGVYSVGKKIVIADPIGSPDGYYIMVDSIEEAYREIVDSGVLDGDRPDETACIERFHSVIIVRRARCIGNARQS